MIYADKEFYFICTGSYIPDLDCPAGAGGRDKPSNNARIFETVKGIVVYPNPASDHFTVFIPEDITKITYQVRLFSLLGNLILQHTVAEGENPIETNAIPNGLYFFDIERDSRTIVHIPLLIHH